jgi:hypothetical protein
MTAGFQDIRTLVDSTCAYRDKLSEIIHSCEPQSNPKTHYPSISSL